MFEHGPTIVIVLAFVGGMALISDHAMGQEPFELPRADSVVVDVIPVVAADSQGTRYDYRLVSGESSIQAIDLFGVSVPKGGVEDLQFPKDWRDFFPWEEARWLELFPKKTRLRTLSWAAIHPSAIIPPGGQLAEFAFRSAWFPGQATYWVQGFTKIPNFPRGSAPPVKEKGSSLFENSVSDTTIGPVVRPEAVDEPAEIVGQMEELLAFACRRDWIDNRGICNSLTEKLDQLARSIERGRAQTARNQLRAFRSELEAQRGKHVDESAFSVLDLYARRLAERL